MCFRSCAGLVRSLLAITAEAPDAATQAAQFISAFTAQYGDTHPAWVATGWREAAAAAHAEFKFLFVYLHSPEHESTEAYVRAVLCNPEVVAYANSHFVCWGGNVQQPDAFNLAGRLNVSTYPCVALLAFSGTRTKLVAAAQGSVQPQQLLSVLRRAVDEQEVMLTAERLEQEERVSWWLVGVVGTTHQRVQEGHALVVAAVVAAETAARQVFKMKHHACGLLAVNKKQPTSCIPLRSC